MFVIMCFERDKDLAPSRIISVETYEKAIQIAKKLRDSDNKYYYVEIVNKHTGERLLTNEY